MDTISSIADRRSSVSANNVITGPLVYETYQKLASMVLYPELRGSARAEFDPAKLEQWFHGDYIKGRVSGNIIWDYLMFNDLLSDCLGFHELEGIQRKGSVCFEKNFEGKAVFGWRAALMLPNGDYRVPYLIGYGGMVHLALYFMGGLWHENFIAPRFPQTVETSETTASLSRSATVISLRGNIH